MNKENPLFYNSILKHSASINKTDGFANLYNTHLDAVFNYCLFRVRDRQTAEDLTADTFEKAWRARHQYQSGRAAFNTWLFTIARHVVTDWQRRQARRPLSRLWPWHVDGKSSPEAQVEETEQQVRLRKLVQTLPPHEQELIALKFGAGMNNREIAGILDKSESAIGSALHRTVKKLREQLGQS